MKLNRKKEMNNGMDNGGEDPFADIWITNWERQCEIDLENEPDLEVEVQHDRDLSTQKLWYLFQNSATSVAQLFKGNHMIVTAYSKVLAFLMCVSSIRSESASGALAPISECSWHYYFPLQRYYL